MTFTKRIVCMALTVCFLLLISCNDDNESDLTSETEVTHETSNNSSVLGEQSESSLNESSLPIVESSQFSSISSESSDVISIDSSDSADDTSENTSEVTGENPTSSVEFTSEEESSIDENEMFLYEVLSPELKSDLAWEYNKLELYNTDFRMSDELAEKLSACLNSYSQKQSVMLIEVDTGMTFAFNKDQKIATASSIKGPFGLFVYKAIESGLLSWDTQIVYRSSHYQANSTGKVQNSSFGTAFSVKTLVDYMIRISDNQAYLMFKSVLGRDRFQKMMENLGCGEIIAPGSNWGNITASEMAAAWREIYYYWQYNSMGEELFDRFMHAQYNYIWRAIPQYEAAHKSGWSGKAFNDAGVVFADGHEYILVVLCGRNGVYDDAAKYQFTKTTKLLADLMVEYNAFLDQDAAEESESSFPESIVISEISKIDISNESAETSVTEESISE